MEKFNEVINSLKDYLKEHLTTENTEVFTHIDKELDKAVEGHSSMEKELSEIKDKLISVVKETSFKSEKPPVTATPENEDTPLGIDDAMNEALTEIIEARKGGK